MQKFILLKKGGKIAKNSTAIELFAFFEILKPTCTYALARSLKNLGFCVNVLTHINTGIDF